MSDAHRTIEAVWKSESTRLIAAIARVTHDIGIAEELAQDALVAALERWPEEGIPENPAGWLMTAAKRRAYKATRKFIPWDLVDLSRFSVKLKAEFQGSNRDMYRAEAIVASSAK